MEAATTTSLPLDESGTLAAEEVVQRVEIAAPSGAAVPAPEAPLEPIEATGEPKVDAALAEDVEPAPKKTVTFGELSLELPDSLPDTILFDLTTLELSGDDPMPAFRLLHSMLEGEQFVRVRNEIANAGGIERISDLLGAIFDQYGISLGE